MPGRDVQEHENSFRITLEEWANAFITLAAVVMLTKCVLLKCKMWFVGLWFDRYSWTTSWISVTTTSLISVRDRDAMIMIIMAKDRVPWYVRSSRARWRTWRTLPMIAKGKCNEHHFRYTHCIKSKDSLLRSRPLKFVWWLQCMFPFHRLRHSRSFECS